MQKVTDNIFLLVLFAMSGTFILAISFILFFLRHQKRMLQKNAAMQKAALAFSEQLLNATIQSQEDERKRIGQDLHDDVGGSLSNFRMMLSQNNLTSNRIAEYKPLLDKIITNVRSISHSLSPPGLDLFGLEHTLYELFDTINASGTIYLTFENNLGSTIDLLSKQTALAIYRIMQELIANTLKHAEAKNISVKFYTENIKAKILYKDDGKGYHLNSNKNVGMGSQNIIARLRMINATYVITTAPNNGFEMLISLQD